MTPFNCRLAILLAMAMFVLVVDTSLMNVSISAVVQDLDTTVSGVQGAIALEALVSAAFILIGGKTGDLIGRKLAYILGLLGYAVGAIAMVFAQDLTAIIVFWAIIGGIGASLLLPAMQSLIHGNFEGAQQKRVYALVGASAAIAAAVGPLLGGFITTFLSWRVGFALEAVIIAVVLAGIGLVKDVPYHGDRSIDLVGALLSIVGMGGVVTGILVWQEGGGYVGLIIGIGVLGARPLRVLAAQPQAPRQAHAARPRSVRIEDVPSRSERPAAAADRPRRHDDRAPDLPADGVRVQRAAGRTLDRAALAEHVRRRAARRARPQATSREHHPVGLRARRGGSRDHRADRAHRRLGLVPHDPAHHRGLRPRPARLAAEQLHALPDLRRAGQRGGGRELGGGSFGLSFGLAFAGAIMLATLAFTFTASAEASTVLSPEEQQQVSAVLEEDAEIMSNTGLEELLVDEPPEVQAEILRINTDSRFIALQVALFVPILAGLLGILNALPDAATPRSRSRRRRPRARCSAEPSRAIQSTGG